MIQIGHDRLLSALPTIQSNANNLQHQCPKEKPMQVKRLSIETLMNDSDEEKLSAYMNSIQNDNIKTDDPRELESKIMPKFHVSKVPISNLVNSYDGYIYSLRDNDLIILKELHKKLYTTHGYRYACAGISKWLKGICYEIDQYEVDILTNILSVI